MTAAPGMPAVWKAQLLAGRADEMIAAACAPVGDLAWAIVAGSQSWHSDWGDRSLFEELRIDPYHRTLAAVHPHCGPSSSDLIASVGEHPLSLVHADFSPKNLLVGPAGLMMVDFETGHFGDPAFDLGFFQSHLVLKAFFHAPQHEPMLRLSDLFWRSYRSHLALRVAPGESGRSGAADVAEFCRLCAGPNRRQEPGRLPAISPDAASCGPRFVHRPAEAIRRWTGRRLARCGRALQSLGRIAKTEPNGNEGE